MEHVMTGIVMFDLEEKSLALCETRGAMLARNIANSDTPHYKSVDLNFTEALAKAQQSSSLTTTNNHHLQGSSGAEGAKTYYRVPMQSSQDGNTVDDEIERKNFIENALHYQASLGFVHNKASSLLRAIKGE
jgi:flagellar basal-body rod protein FlgB